jgi:c-di-GMP-binding flagellar brake protein YcgR
MTYQAPITLNFSLAQSSINRQSARIDIRVPVKVTVQTANESKEYDAEIANISEGGAFIRGVFPVELGSKVTIQIGEQNMESQVRWVRGSAQSGIGTQFLGAAKRKKAFLSKLIQRAVFGEAK